MIRIDILDDFGNIVGFVEFPNDTPSSELDKALIKNQRRPQAPTASERIRQSLALSQEFGISLEDKFKEDNVMWGITQSGKTVPVTEYMRQVFIYLNTGSLYGARDIIRQMIASDDLIKPTLAPFVTNEVLIKFLHKIEDYLRLPRSVYET